MKKREHDRKDRNIVDRKSEKSVDLVDAFQSLTNLAPNGGTRAHEVSASTA